MKYLFFNTHSYDLIRRALFEAHSAENPEHRSLGSQRLAVSSYPGSYFYSRVFRDAYTRAMNHKWLGRSPVVAASWQSTCEKEA